MDSEFTSQRGKYIDENAGLFARLATSTYDMRKGTRRLIDEKPSEGRIVFYLIISDLIFALSWSLRTLVFPTETNASQDVPVIIALWLIGAIMVRTAIFYICSIPVWFMCANIGGEANWCETKAGMFWGSLVSAPFGFLAAILTMVLIAFEGHNLSDQWAVLIPHLISLIAFLWYISAGVTEAHNFKTPSILFTVLSIIIFGIYIVLITLNIESLH